MIAILEQVAKVLKVPASASRASMKIPFQSLDKVIELYDQKIALYERILKEKDEMMARLKKLIAGK